VREDEPEPSSQGGEAKDRTPLVDHDERCQSQTPRANESHGNLGAGALQHLTSNESASGIESSECVRFLRLRRAARSSTEGLPRSGAPRVLALDTGRSALAAGRLGARCRPHGLIARPKRPWSSVVCYR